MEISLFPLIEFAINVLIALVLALGSWGITKLTKKLKVDGDSQLKEWLSDGLMWAVDYAEGELRSRGQKLTLKTKNEVLNMAVKYTVDRFPDTMRDLGLDEARITEMVLARLNLRVEDDE